MSLLAKIKAQMQESGLKASKGLGQNFLITEKIYETIIEAGQVTSADTVIEVGPGWGTLTDYLAATGARVIAIEKDRNLIPELEQIFAGNSRVNITEADALSFDPLSVGVTADHYKVIGNIPYYISSRLIRTIFESWPRPSLIILMLQKEVAQRIVARPPQMSLLGVSVQYYATARIVTKVSASHFYPRPKVDSAILTLTPHTDQSAPATDFTEAFFTVVRAGFKEKRKQLLNNLASELDQTKELMSQYLVAASIDPRRRAETLTIDEWKRLTSYLIDMHIF